MSMSDALPDLAIAIDKGRINASEITASELLKLHIFALGVRDSLDEVTEIATDVDGIGTMQRRFPRKYLKVGLALEQGDEIANLVPYYSVIREGLREESFEGVEERANEILKYTQKTAGEMFNAGKIPQRF